MRFTARDASRLAHLLRDAARTEVMPRFRKLGAAAVRAKSGPLDLVSDADEAAERLIAGRLRQIYPGCVVVGEEAATADPTLLTRLADADLAFLVDPIDGTANYCAGLPLFGMMVAALVRGQVVMAAIHDPILDDTACAIRGEGAWIEDAAGRRTDLRVALPAPLDAMGGAVSWRYVPEPLRTTVLRNLPKLGAAWDMRCAAAQYRIAASGQCHLLVYFRTLPWDHAPGWLLHREAGGWSARLDGSPYHPTHSTGGLICTPDEASWHQVRTALFELPGPGGLFDHDADRT